MSVRMIALDLDGTALTKEKRITGRMLKALREAVSRGILVVPATGRPMSGMPEDLELVRGIRYVISSNGAVLLDTETRKLISGKFLDPALTLRLLRIPLERNLLYNVFVDGYGYSSPVSHERLMETFRGTPLETYVGRSRRPHEDIRSLVLHAAYGVENFWIITGSRAERDQIADEIRVLTDANILLTAPRDIEVVSPEADKGAAVLALCRHLGISPEEVMAIGDNENDAGMLSLAGISVAMGNASPEIQRMARFVTDDSEHGGAAKAIERFAL